MSSTAAKRTSVTRARRRDGRAGASSSGSSGARASLKWETLRVDRPEIHYARSGNVYVGYQAFGSGPFDLVVVPGAPLEHRLRLGVRELAELLRSARLDRARPPLRQARHRYLGPRARCALARGTDGRCASGHGRRGLGTSCTDRFVGRRSDRRLVRGDIPRAHGCPHSQHSHRSREVGIRLPVGKPRRARQRRLVRGRLGNTRSH